MCAVVLVAPAGVDGDAQDGEGAALVDVSEKLGVCKVSMKDANTQAAVESWIKNTWLKTIDWTKITVEDRALDAGYDSNLSVKVESFTPAVKGTSSDKGGTEGSCTFSIIDSKNAITAKVTCKIEPVFDYDSIKCEVSMEDCKSEQAVLDWLNTTWLNTFKTETSDDGILSIEKISFKPAVGGTGEKREGSDGSLKFNVKKTVEGTTSTVAEDLVCKIVAYDYGPTQSTDKTVTYEGAKLSGLVVDSKNHVITEKDLEKLVKALGGKDGALVESFTGKYTEYTNPLVFGEGDKTWKYENGDVVRYDGRSYVLLIGEEEFSLFSVDGKGWVKFERGTNELILDIEDSQYLCAPENKVININDVPYIVGYSEYDTQTPPLQGREYILFLYDLKGESAGYMVMQMPGVLRNEVTTTFVFNKGMGPDDREDDKPVTATYTSDKGKMTLLYSLASKDVSVKNKDKAVSSGDILIPLGKVDVAKTGFYAIGKDDCSEQTVSPKEGGDCTAVCPVTAGTTLVAVLSEACSADIPTADLVFVEKSGGSGKSNTTLYIAVAAVIVLLIGGGFYYVRFMKP